PGRDYFDETYDLTVTPDLGTSPEDLHRIEILQTALRRSVEGAAEGPAVMTSEEFMAALSSADRVNLIDVSRKISRGADSLVEAVSAMGVADLGRLFALARACETFKVGNLHSRELSEAVGRVRQAVAGGEWGASGKIVSLWSQLAGELKVEARDLRAEIAKENPDLVALAKTIEAASQKMRDRASPFRAGIQGTGGALPATLTGALTEGLGEVERDFADLPYVLAGRKMARVTRPEAEKGAAAVEEAAPVVTE
ncbi:MAG: hypothetical protein WC352_04060, partial [Candidatus Omnitrophota bacterium]